MAQTIEQQQYKTKVKRFYFGPNGDKDIRRRALIVGFGKYQPEGTYGKRMDESHNAPTCQNSVRRIYTFFDNLFVQLRVDDGLSLVPDEDSNVSEEALRNTNNSDRLNQALDKFFAESAETLFFYYSGHGVMRGNNRTDKEELHLCLPLQCNDEKCGLRDYFPVSDIIERAKNAKFRSFVMVLDCCFSGNVATAPIFDNLPVGMCVLTAGLSGAEVPAGVETSIIGKHQSDWALKDAIRVPQVSEDKKERWKKVQDRGKEAYAFTKFSTFFIEAMCGGAANPLGIVTLTGIYQYISEALGTNHAHFYKEEYENKDWSHARPMIKSTLDHEVPLAYVDNILSYNVLDALAEFSKKFRPNERFPETATIQEDEMNPKNLGKLIMMGLVRKEGQLLSEKGDKLVPGYKITPRGWHYRDFFVKLLESK